MKNKEIQEEIIVDYVAKERAERTCCKQLLKIIKNIIFFLIFYLNPNVFQTKDKKPELYL